VATLIWQLRHSCAAALKPCGEKPDFGTIYILGGSGYFFMY